MGPKKDGRMARKMVDTSKAPGTRATTATSSSSKSKDLDSRAQLIQRVKLMEEEIEKFEFERGRLLRELDHVCEEKDNQIKELKTQLNDKQVEMEYISSSHYNEKGDLNEEVSGLKNQITTTTEEFQNKEEQYQLNISVLESKLKDLTDYMSHKERTVARIKELEDELEASRSNHESKRIEMETQIEIRKTRIQEEISKRVAEITVNLERVCMKKLEADARIAIDKFVEINAKYEADERVIKKIRKETSELNTKLNEKQLRLQISESLLNEMLKQLQRKLLYRSEKSAQTYGLND